MVSETTLSVSREILTSLVVIIAAYSFKKLVTDMLVDEMEARAKLSKHDLAALQKVLAVIVYFIAFAYILTIFNLKEPLLVLLSGAGFAGIVVGFAAKDVIANFIGGIILLLDRTFRIGDIVEISDIVGTVSDIKIRTTVIYTADGEYVTIPNSVVMTSVIKNRSAPDTLYRVKLSIGIGYESDVGKATNIMLGILKKHRDVIKMPPPQVYFKSFGDSSLELEAFYWLDLSSANIPGVKTEIHSQIAKEFRKARIKIPYRQVEVTLKKA
ncbi:MAG: mechanosensitive ion channel family protein [Candidatus Aenigmarchaeota archaeon]|nr:mechanosensitive ion channel family protein [Candidatus Aenigmarchaeota archaeon]